jgi:serine/threonine protein kinase
VLMDFAPGEELGTYYSRWSADNPRLADRILMAQSIVTQLFNCLKTMESLGIVHQDLNPKNIICTRDGDSLSLRIIDFGRNYVLTESLGSAARIQKVAEYVAPELQATDPGKINTSTDLYSVGRILLDVLRPQTGPGVSRSERLKGLYQETPSLAGVVEDLMSPSPDFRARGCTPGKIADCVLNRLVASFEVASKLDGRDGEMALTLRRGIVPALTGSLLSRVRELHSISKLKAKNDESAARSSAFLFHWAVVVWVGFMVSWLLFVALTLRDIGLQGGPFSAFLQQIKIPADHNAVMVNLPGRLVILSFVTISADYYMNIFSGISFWSFSTMYAKLTDIWIRFAAVSCLPLAVLVYFWQPQSWALYSALGTLIITINNVLTYKTCVRLLNSPTEHGPVRSTVEAGRADLADFFRPGEFGSWASLMLWYSFGLLGVGLLLHFHVAHDTWVYATLFICLNILKIEYSNCNAQAPKVRGNVARVIALGWRSVST